MQKNKIFIMGPTVFVLPEDFTGDYRAAIREFLEYHLSEECERNSCLHEDMDIDPDWYPVTEEEKNTMQRIIDKHIRTLWRETSSRMITSICLYEWEGEKWESGSKI